jgi:hypothetical protein
MFSALSVYHVSKISESKVEQYTKKKDIVFFNIRKKISLFIGENEVTKHSEEIIVYSDYSYCISESISLND